MLQTNNQFYKLILMFILVLLIPAAISNVQVLIGADSLILMRIEAVLMIASLLSAFVYILKGYSKNMAKAYKVFLYTFLAEAVLSIVSVIVTSNQLADMDSIVLPIILSVIIALCIAILAFVKDLGKTKSFIAAGVLLATTFVSYFMGSSAHEGVVRGGEVIYTSIGLLRSSTVLLAFTLGFLVIAKYVDKTARGTK